MLIKLFISFFKVGLFSFGGGYAALPLIQEEVVNLNSWLSISEFNNLITISQMTPGPIAINSASFVGTRVYGLSGAIVASLGCVTPSFIIVGTISYFYNKYRKLDSMQSVLGFLRPAVVSMILAAGIDILKTAFFDVNKISFENLDISMVVLFFLMLFAIRKTKIDPIILMLGSGFIYLCINLILWGFMGKINYNLKMEEIIKSIKKEDKRPRLLLQVCCAPCSSSVLTRLREYFAIDIYYYNPNIYPANELNKRVETVKELVDEMNLDSKVIFPENNPEDFYKFVENRKNDHEGGDSCYKCYQLRLEKSAKYAKENSYDYFTTTLSISPYKNSAWLNEIGEKLEEEYGIKYLYSDFKKKNGYKDSIDLSKKYNLYRQDYCGCVFSFKEMQEKKHEK